MIPSGRGSDLCFKNVELPALFDAIYDSDILHDEVGFIESSDLLKERFLNKERLVTSPAYHHRKLREPSVKAHYGVAVVKVHPETSGFFPLSDS